MLAQPLLFKLAGALALLGGGAYAAYTESARDRARLYRMDCLITLVKQMRTKIERYLTPVGEILRQCDAELLRGCLTGVDGCPNERPHDVDELVFSLRRGAYFEDGKDALCALAASGYAAFLMSFRIAQACLYIRHRVWARPRFFVR